MLAEARLGVLGGLERILAGAGEEIVELGWTGDEAQAHEAAVYQMFIGPGSASRFRASSAPACLHSVDGDPRDARARGEAAGSKRVPAARARRRADRATPLHLHVPRHGRPSARASRNHAAAPGRERERAMAAEAAAGQRAARARGRGRARLATGRHAGTPRRAASGAALVADRASPDPPRGRPGGRRRGRPRHGRRPRRPAGDPELRGARGRVGRR